MDSSAIDSLLGNNRRWTFNPTNTADRDKMRKQELYGSWDWCFDLATKLPSLPGKK